MKFLIVDTDYPAFLSWLYAQHPSLAARSYADQLQARNDSLFGLAASYSRALRELGHEAFDFYANNYAMQHAWARENAVSHHARRRWEFRLRRGIVPWLSRKQDKRWLLEIFEAQIRHYKPDVLVNLCPNSIDCDFMKRIRADVRLLLGQYAATPLPDKEDWSVYDLLLSSFPPQVDWMRSKGVHAELFRLAFEPRVLEAVSACPRTIPVSFVGSFQAVHESRTALIETLCVRYDVQVWTSDTSCLSADSPIRRRIRGEAFGVEMYRILRSSQITINHHGSIPPFANNLRLYEATGVGTCLLTDWKANLDEMFEPDREVLAYRSADECMALLQRYLDDETARGQVALAGQQRTLAEHTFDRRMRELLVIIGQRL